MSERQASPWGERDDGERAWADGQPDRTVAPSRRDVDDDARDFFRPDVVEGDRSYRRPSRTLRPSQPQRDLIWEGDALEKLNALPYDTHLGVGDRVQALHRLRSLIDDIAGSQGPVAADPGSLGGVWRQAFFATSTLTAAGRRQLQLEERLRAVLNPNARNLISVAPQMDTELAALPQPLQARVIDTLDRLITAKITQLQSWEQQGWHDRVSSANPDLQHLYRAHLGDGRDLVYLFTPSAELDAHAGGVRPSQDRRSPHGLDPLPRSTLHVLGVLPADPSPDQLRSLIAERVSLSPRGSILYRILPARHSPTGRDAVQVLTVQLEPLSEDAITAHVNALRYRTRAYQRAVGAERPLRYSRAIPDRDGTPTTSGAVVVDVVGRTTRNTTGNGVSHPRTPKPAVEESYDLASFERGLTTQLPADRGYELRFTEAGMREFTALPLGDVKTSIAHQLQDLAQRGPQPTDARDRQSGGPEPSAASRAAARDYDLSGLRPRYVGDHQIIYAVIPPTLRRDGRWARTRQFPDRPYEGQQGTRQRFRPEFVAQQRAQAQQLIVRGALHTLLAQQASLYGFGLSQLANTAGSLLTRGQLAWDRYQDMSSDTPAETPAATVRAVAAEEEYRPSILVAGILKRSDPDAAATIASRLPYRARTIRDSRKNSNRGLSVTPERSPSTERPATITSKLEVITRFSNRDRTQTAWLRTSRADADMVQLVVSGWSGRIEAPRDALVAGTTRHIEIKGLHIAPSKDLSKIWFGVQVSPDRVIRIAAPRDGILAFLDRLPERVQEGPAQQAERIADRSTAPQSVTRRNLRRFALSRAAKRATSDIPRPATNPPPTSPTNMSSADHASAAAPRSGTENRAAEAARLRSGTGRAPQSSHVPTTDPETGSTTTRHNGPTRQPHQR
ncbi:hypothetical protein [Nonomuraea sp. KM90]|uniref:hypothetical protein n=1 Tax=Nonomuraea sp. KM90 TaxID=3457428 RepID=UPI003FCE5A1E